MPRLVNTKTGVVANVSEETAARLGSEWQHVEDEPEKKPAPKRASVKK